MYLVLGQHNSTLKAGLIEGHIGFLESKLEGIEAGRSLLQIVITKSLAPQLKTVGLAVYKRDLRKVPI